MLLTLSLLPSRRFDSELTTTLARIDVHVWISSSWARTHKANSRLRNIAIFRRNFTHNTTVLYCCKATNAQRKLIRSKVLMPLTADLARPSRRATSIAIVLSGLLMGVLLARVLGGIIAQFSSFRNIYWMGVGGKNICRSLSKLNLPIGQFLLLFAIYLVCPDVPVKNPDLTYLQILFTMLKFAVTEPLLIQGALILFAGSAIFAGFWVTMTFLLAGAPYHYSTQVAVIFPLS